MALKNIWKITLCFPREDVSTSKAGLMKEFLKQSRKENGSDFREVGIRSEGREKKKKPNQKTCLSSKTIVLELTLTS